MARKKLQPPPSRPETVEQGRFNLEVAEQLYSLAGGLGGAVFLSDKTIGTSTTRIPHGQKGVPRAWFPVSLEGDARVWQTSAPDTTYLYLRASASVTCIVVVIP